MISLPCLQFESFCQTSAHQDEPFLPGKGGAVLLLNTTAECCLHIPTWAPPTLDARALSVRSTRTTRRKVVFLRPVCWTLGTQGCVGL
jgi:hypothetical protein